MVATIKANFVSNANREQFTVKPTERNDISMEKSMTMQEFVDWMAEQNNMTREEATQAYCAVINGIKYATANGMRLQLYGFGTFYLQLHKGHKMQFQPTKNITDDYLVLKFSASSSLNKHIRDGKFSDPNFKATMAPIIEKNKTAKLETKEA